MRTEAIPSRALAWALLVVGLLACGLRLWALDFSLPGVYHPDEIPILNRALAFAKGDLNPHNFLYPSLFFYTLFAWEGLYFLTGYAAGTYPSLRSFEEAYFREPSAIILAARALTATCGVLTVAVTYRFGANMYGRAVGLSAALFLAVAPFAVRDAHYIKLDVPVALFAALTLAAVARIVVDPAAAGRTRSWMLAGALAGLTVSTHYYAAVIVLPIVAAAVADVPRSGRWQSSFRLLVWAGIAAVLGFWAGSPFLPLEPLTALRDMVAVREIDIDRAVAGGSAFVSLGAYLKMLATDAIGWPVAAAAVVGLTLAIREDWRRGLVLASFPLAFLAFAANTVPMSRYLNVMLPSMAVAAGFALATVSCRLRRSSPVALAVLAVVLALPGLAASVRSDRFFAQRDTRALALAFVEREIPDGATVLIQPHGVPLRSTRDSLVAALRANLGSDEKASVKFQRQLALSPYPTPAYRLIYLGEPGGSPPPDIVYLSRRVFVGEAGLEPLRKLQVNYVILTRASTPNPAFASLQAALEGHASLVRSFSPYRADAGTLGSSVEPYFHNTATRIDPALERPGPIVDIWRVD